MNYLKKVLANLKELTPLFAVGGVLLTVIMAFSGFPQNSIPRPLTHPYLLVYTCVLSTLTLAAIALCLLQPVVTSRELVEVWRLVRNIVRPLKPMSAPVVIASSVLLATSVVMIYSLTSVLAHITQGSDTYFLKRQALWGLLGMLALYFFARFNYSLLRKFGPPLMVIEIIALVTAVTASYFSPDLLPPEDHASTILAFTSSGYFEVTKAVFLLYAGSVLCRRSPGTVLTVPPLTLFLLIYILRGTAGLNLITLLSLSLLLMVVARISIRTTALVFIGFVLICLAVSTFRLYQLSQGFGGLIGVGLGLGRAKLFSSQPQPILEGVLEEMGFIGAMILVILLALFCVSGMMEVLKARDPFGRLLGTGFLATVWLQALPFITCATQYFPTTGLSFPFLAYGLVQIMVNMSFAGILVRIRWEGYTETGENWGTMVKC